jgi:hypothetical protein
MYYIYHIPGVKIGCTSNIKRRMKEQGFISYEILEKYSNAIIASKREIELQKEYGYKIDTLQYNINQYKNMGSNGGKSTQEKYNNGPKNGLGSIKNLGKEVYQYDLNGNFIKKYPSRNFVIRNLKIQIQHCLAGRTTQAGGFIWKYINQ